MSVRAYAKLGVIIGGIVGLGIELAAERLLAPAFGTTLDLWSIIIGLTFTFLSIGYSLGGRIIDRNPTPKVIGVCLLIAGVWAGFIALAGRAIVDQIQEWTFDFGGLRLGIFLSTLVLITLPPLVIGVITPAAIRLTVPRVGHAGTSAGTIYALGTLGSLLGTFVPVIVLIPRIGVRNTFLTMAVLGIASGALGLTGAVQQDATDPLAVDASAPVQVRDAEVEGAHR